MEAGLIAASRDEQDAAGKRAPHLATGDVVERFGQEPAQALYAAFQQYNAEHWEGRLAAPLVLITNTGSPMSLGDYIARDVHGLESRIRIAPASFKRGMAFALDVLLHEMVHAWQEEIAGDGENGHRGHGPLFAAECNRIGAKLGLPPVFVRSKKTKGMPLCNYWPMSVRPEGYYGTEWQPTKRKPKGDTPEGGAGEGGEEDAPDRVAVLLAGLCKLDTDTLRKLQEGIAEELAARD